jgi:hypothetical protein
MLTPGKKAGLLIIGVLIIVIAAWQIYKYSLIHDQVTRAVVEKSKGLYHIHYERLSLDAAAGILHVKNIELTPDTALYRQMVEEKRNPPLLVKVYIPALDVLGVKTPKALLSKQIEGRKIEMADPRIEILLGPSQKKDTTAYDPARDISKELLGKLQMIKVDSVSLLRADVTVRRLHSDAMAISGKYVSCLLSGLLIDSLAVKDSSRILFSRSLDLVCDELQFPSENRKYRLYMSKVRYSSKDDALDIGGIRLKPQLPEAEFARSFPVQKDRYDFSLEEVRLLHFDRKGLWNKRIEADSLIVRESFFKVYRDLSYPHDTVSKVGKYPQQQLMRMSIPIDIRKVLFLHSFIEYKEKNAKSDSAGKLQFFDVSATVDNVTNRRPAISRDNACTLNFRAKLLDRAPVDARLVLLLNDRKGRFSIEGNIGAMDVMHLNPLTQPMGLARMEKGRIDKLHFAFSGNDSSCEGQVTMLYDDLKVSLLKKNKQENKYEKKGLASLVTNVIMKNSNPGKGGDPRTVHVQFRRILNKSFFNLIWKTLFTGVKETVGVK